MSDLGKRIRLNRIFSHPSGRILAVAVDHFCNYSTNMPDSLKRMGETLAKIIEGQPNSVTMNKGIAMHFWKEHAGKVPLIIQQVAARPDDRYFPAHTSVEEVITLGADAIAVAMCIKGNSEAEQLRRLAGVVADAGKVGLPVIAHIYPLDPKRPNEISLPPEDIWYAVRFGLEMGVDVIKVPYTGDVASFRDIVALSPAPVVSAGGPTCNTLEEAAQMLRDVVQAGAAGSTVGRNVWGFPDCAHAIRVLKKAVHGEA